jgi:hypothetical protein
MAAMLAIELFKYEEGARKTVQILARPEKQIF